LFVGFFALSVATLVASIGLLQRRQWARRAFVAILAIGVLVGLGRAVASAFYPAQLPSSEEGTGPFVLGRIAWIADLGLTLTCCVAFAWIALRLGSPRVRDEFKR